MLRLLAGALPDAGFSAGSVTDPDITVATEITPAVVAWTLLGPAAAAVAAVMATMGVAKDCATDQGSGNTTDECAVAAKFSLGRSR